MERRIDPTNPSRAGWCYLVAEPDGTVLRAGALSDCSGCHGAAPEGVFTTVGP